MSLNLSRKKIKNPLLEKVEELSGQNVYACYQCGKCSAGCPLTDEMDCMPNQVIRCIQLGDESILDCKAVWLCASCFTCATRCPHGIDIARVMDAVRQLALRKNADKINVCEIDKELLKRAPQQLIVCAMRKYTG